VAAEVQVQDAAVAGAAGVAPLAGDVGEALGGPLRRTRAATSGTPNPGTPGTPRRAGVPGRPRLAASALEYQRTPGRG
jgi:hypothetical protein